MHELGLNSCILGNGFVVSVGGKQYRFVFAEARAMLYDQDQEIDNLVPVRWVRGMDCMHYVGTGAEMVMATRMRSYQSPRDRWCAAKGRKEALGKVLDAIMGGAGGRKARSTVWAAYHKWESLPYRRRQQFENEDYRRAVAAGASASKMEVQANAAN